MILYPAIDLKDGQCVRLIRGDMASATVFADDPAAQAKAFVAAGCGWLHLVDLNGAFAGKPVNAAAVEAILASVAVPVQLGGGIRDLATIEAWLSRGLARVILGTVAVEDLQINRMLHKDPNQRYQTHTELIGHLQYAYQFAVQFDDNGFGRAQWRHQPGPAAHFIARQVRGFGDGG